ncbi:aminopeptidase N [Microlunatus soli]|uniref:Aminopeptidase N n=1 Tax=Microlunatus soli TaxID=630515 RepID=A0A1H1QAK2_9ACTN|nr:aminopeptidase N [Microlunatus soli]SDS20430.1 Membrane alanyl aminopeptidase Metallo peptidase. MEROPS family M01 [Microlunatus soli]
MPSLTHAEARERAKLITVRDTHVALDLMVGADPAGERDGEFGSVTTIDFDAVVDSATFLDFKGIRLNAVTLNGQRIDPAGWHDGRIALTGLQARNTVVVDGVMAYSSDGEGLHRHVDPADGNVYLYGMSFLDAAPRWFGCFDQPDLKSRYVLEVLAPEDWTVHGNGPSVRVGEETPRRQAQDTSSTGSGLSGAGLRWRIEPPEPLSTYFVTLVAGPYASLYTEHDGIRCGIHVRASLGEALQREADDIFTVTAQCFDYYHDIFGVRYPFGEYHQAFVPDFNAGAMENPGCVTFRDSFIYRSRATVAERASRAGVIAHEMAHQWFGDLVTMRWWDDLWLNESFAEYMAHRCATAATDYPLWTEFGIVRKAWGYAADQSDATHPVAGNGAADAATALQNFDGISYAKGAAVLRQLASYLGDEIFLGGLRHYFAEYAFGNAEFAELLAAWTEAGGVDLERWSKEWLLTAGVDTLAVRRLAGGDQELVRVAPVDRPADRSHSVEVGAFSAAGERLDSQRVIVGDLGVAVGRPSAAVAMIPDIQDETWAKIRFDAADWTSITGLVSKITDGATRVTIWNSLRDQVRDAETDPRAALSMITEQLGDEVEDVIASLLLRYAARDLAGSYAPVPQRADRLASVNRLASSMVAAAEPGSDRQLVAFRTVIGSSADVDRLDGWRRHADLPPGLDLDPELTWQLVTRICSLSDRPDVIAETLAADQSSAAAVNAARARAALPTAEAKAAAYRLLVEPSDTSAYELYATAEAMFGYSAEQVELTRDYAVSFFRDITRTADFRSGWALGRLPALAFPLAVTEHRVLTATEELLAASGTPAVIRRAVADEVDGLRRALASVDRFSG